MLPSGVSILTFFSLPLASLSTLMEQPAVTSERARHRSETSTRRGSTGMTKNPPPARYAMRERLVPKIPFCRMTVESSEKRAIYRNQRLYCRETCTGRGAGACNVYGEQVLNSGDANDTGQNGGQE